jgi:hypothetical protein
MPGAQEGRDHQTQSSQHAMPGKCAPTPDVLETVPIPLQPTLAFENRWRVLAAEYAIEG